MVSWAGRRRCVSIKIRSATSNAMLETVINEPSGLSINNQNQPDWVSKTDKWKTRPAQCRKVAAAITMASKRVLFAVVTSAILDITILLIFIGEQIEKGSSQLLAVWASVSYFCFTVYPLPGSWRGRLLSQKSLSLIRRAWSRSLFIWLFWQIALPSDSAANQVRRNVWSLSHKGKQKKSTAYLCSHR